MSRILFAALIASGLALAPAAWADEALQSKAPATEQSAVPKKPKYDYGVHDACMGDRYESDEDINFGNTISEEEILTLINPPGA